MKIKKELKNYEKPLIEKYGNLKKLTKGAETGEWDEAGYFT